jgi:hypothetical protein
MGRLSLSDRYLASLAEDTLLDRAIASKQRTAFERAKRDCEDSLKDLCERAASEAERLGQRYRQRLAADIVTEAVHPHEMQVG